MRSVAHIGNEFYGFGVGNSFGDETSAFPKLKTLEITSMEQWEDWKLPNTKIMPRLIELTLQYCPKLSLGFDPEIFGDGDGVVLFPELKKLSLQFMGGLERLTSPHMWVSKVKVMPNLLHLDIRYCWKLRELPDVAIFESLETLFLDGLREWSGREEEKGEVYTITDQKHDGRSLRSVRINCCPWLLEWSGREEEKGEVFTITDQKQDGRSLRSVWIYHCPSLNVVPRSMFSPTPRQLLIYNCPELRGKQPCLPPLLEKLRLANAGVFSESLHLKDTESYSSLRSLRILGSDQVSLPKGFNRLKSLQRLELGGCESLDFELKELQQFTMLQRLEIYKCPILRQRFQGEEWRNILPRIPDITIEGEKLTETAKRLNA